MLIRVAIDPTIARELASGESPQPGGMLIRYLRERCLIALGAQSDAEELLSAFATSGQPELAALVGQLLQHRLADRPAGASPVAMSEIDDPQQTSTWATLADLLLMPGWRVELINECGEVLSPEVTSMRDALHCRSFDRLDHAWSRWVEEGESRESIWREVFKPFATRCRTVYVVDRYFAKTFSAEVRLGQKAIKNSGAGWFLAHLSRSATRTVHIVTSARELRRGEDADEVGQGIQEWFDHLRSQAKLDLHVVGGDFRHRRSLAFDGYAGFAIDKGLETFSGPTIHEEFELIARAATAQKVAGAFRELRDQGSNF